MAKKKNGKTKTSKLPKRIAGVKVPKELRAPGGRLLQAVNNPLLIDAAAAALMAAANRLAQSRLPFVAAQPKPQADLGTILSSLAIEGMRRFGEGNRADGAAAKAAPAAQRGPAPLE